MWWLRIRNLLAREDTKAGKSAVKASSSEAPVSGRFWLWPLGMGLVILVLHLFLFPPVPRLGMQLPGLGEVADRKITAEVAFEAPRLEENIQDERFRAAMIVSPVLKSSPRTTGTVPTARLDRWLDALGTEMKDVTKTVPEKTAMLDIKFPAVGREAIGWLFEVEEPDSLIQRMDRVGRLALRSGVVNALPFGSYDKVAIQTPQKEDLKNRTEVVVQTELETWLENELRKSGMGTTSASRTAYVLRSFIVPNLVFSPEETQARQDQARQRVPDTRKFRQGETIIDQGVSVTAEQALFLEKLAMVIRERGGGDTSEKITRGFVRVLLVMMSLGLFAWLGSIHFPHIFHRIRSMVTLTVIMAMYLAGSSFALDHPGLGALGVPIILLSLLTTILFRDKVGYVTTILAVALLSILPDVQAVHVFSWFILGMVTVISLRRIRSRSQSFKTILLLTFLSIVLIFVENVGDPEGHSGVYLVGLFSPVLSVQFGLFLLQVVEPLVGVCSDLTLLELSDLNHPLLQRMALEAQGTYHHSQVVGQLAEHAARAIDANSLLTRVGALFHDIGKMQKSEYYVENQSPDFNKHDELSPSMSALVIAAHVKEGIELGRKWRLPQAVIDFIPEHHGTMVMEFFYHKALNSEDPSPVKVDDFRYPGPKPRCRETAILMLADAVEAATRSLAKPTPSRIREITKQIIDKRMLSGELDNSGLTLSDLARIRESFIPLLTGIHHARIVYPGQKERDPDRVPERRGDRKART